jgi:hypothetical protein
MRSIASGRLLLGDQGAVVADLDALHAALAGVGVDGDREQPAAARLAFFSRLLQ